MVLRSKIGQNVRIRSKFGFQGQRYRARTNVWFNKGKNLDFEVKIWVFKGHNFGFKVKMVKNWSK